MNKIINTATMNYKSLVWCFSLAFLIMHNPLRNRPFSTCAKFSESVSEGEKCYLFWKFAYVLNDWSHNINKAKRRQQNSKCSFSNISSKDTRKMSWTTSHFSIYLILEMTWKFFLTQVRLLLNLHTGSP